MKGAQCNKQKSIKEEGSTQIYYIFQIKPWKNKELSNGHNLSKKKMKEKKRSYVH